MSKQTTSSSISNTLDEAKNRAAAALNEAKDKATFVKDQTSDKVNEEYYAGKQQVRSVVQDVKDKARDIMS